MKQHLGEDRIRRHGPCIALAVLVLCAAGWGGLRRIGWTLPPLQPHLVAAHGPLMVAGFLGTLVSLERAAAYGSRWSYGAPFLNGLGAQ